MKKCQVGDRLPELKIPVTTMLVVSGAIATRDFQPVHHNRGAARAAGTKDIFMNMLTTNGLVGRYSTEWAGPYAQLSKMKIGLGAPNFPGDCLIFTGSVADIADDGTVRAEVEGRNSLGVHVSATVHLTWAPEGVPSNA